MHILLTLLLFNLGVEFGAGATWEHGITGELKEFTPAFSWCAEVGVRDILPGIGIDFGFRRIIMQRTIEDDSLDESVLRRWESYFIDAAGVFESWPYLGDRLGVRFRAGGFYCPWSMLEDGELLQVVTPDSADTVAMEEADWGILLGGSVMLRPLKFLILEAGINHRHIFSMDIEKYGEDDEDERLMEVYVGLRARFW